MNGQKYINLDALNRLAQKLYEKLHLEVNNVKEMLGGKAIRYVTQAEYNALSASDKTNKNIQWHITDPDPVQADWTVTNTSSGQYIRNKPTSLPANGGNADTVDGIDFWTGTQAAYDAITNKSATTIYMITEE